MPSSLIDASSHIVLATHLHPDAGSLGSACAFYSYLLRDQKKITLFCASEDIDRRLAFLPWFEKLTHRFPEDADCIISFDCGSYSRLGIEKKLPLINIDHHAYNNGFGAHTIIDTDAISTTEVIYDYFVANGVKINGKIATALYAGLLDDSECFSSGRCNAKTFAMAQHLIECGADHTLCTDWLYRRRSLASFRMRGELFKRMKLLSEGKIAFFEIPRLLFDQTGATLSECKETAEEALQMHSVQAALMVIEQPLGGLKISLRTDGSIDAATIMLPFGGGGHRSRSGIEYNQNDNEIIEKIITMITKELM